ncbi:carbohydrate-binding protein [Streptomyces sp. NPDC051976]|uniref:carbohydrate-binding protein n=1 Tax=Streptomyces sp. NPDC051976 TaxID=3154947 RepID=UPI00342497CE
MHRRLIALLACALIPLGGLLGLTAASGAASAAPLAVPAPPSGWTTLFSDDFNGAAGSGLNGANWLYDTGTGYGGGAAQWGTGEVETATASTANVYQDGAGHMVIKALKDGSGAWTSGRVETQRTDFAAPAGGEVEFSASVLQPNPASGLGYWPAFWALGADARPVGATNWPSIGEFDIMEDVNALSQHSTTFHCGVWAGECHDPDGISSGLQACGGCQTGYHTYSAIIDRTNPAAEQLRFFLDGTLTYTVNENQVSTATWQAAVDHGFFAIFDLAIGGSYPNKVCGCTSPSAATSSGASMSVDWFAVYQKSGSGGTTGGTSTGGTTTGGTTTGGTTTGGTTGGTTTGGSTGGGTGGGAACPGAATSAFAADCYASATLGSATVTTTTDPAPAGTDGNQVSRLASGATLRYDNVNFGSGGSSQFQARVASGAAGGVSGLVNVVLDNPANAPIGSFALANTGGWDSWRTVPANIARTTGTHTVYLEFSSGVTGQPYASLHWFTFPAN